MGWKKKAERSSGSGISPLPKAEIVFYFSVTCLAVLYVCYSVYKDSMKYDGILNLYDFGPGWSFIGRDQDISNYEWHFWYGWFWQVWPWYLTHMVLGKLMEWNLNVIQWRKCVLLMHSLVSLTALLGWKSVCLYTLHTLLLYSVAATHSTTAVWITSLTMLSTLNFEPFVSLMKLTVVDDEEDRWYYLLMFTLSLLNIRSTSFCIEKCWQKAPADSSTVPYLAEQTNQKVGLRQKKTVDQSTKNESPHQNCHTMQYNLVDILFYNFYLPLFFTGPILTYDLFQIQISTFIPKWTLPRVASLGLNFLRFGWWAWFNEFILHFLYFNSMQQNLTVLKSVSLWTLVGIGYCQGQFFMMKYLVMFGLPANVARADGLEPPKGPKCISYIYLYSDMWKYFDRGLYSFLKRYIYIACGGSRRGLTRQVLGSVLCFAYIFYWHGAEYYIFLWILLNFAGIFLEVLTSLMSQTAVVKHIKGQVLSPAQVQRVHCLCAIPVFLLSCFSTFCFFGGQRVGYMFFNRLILEGWCLSWSTLVGILYCAIQNGMELSRWQAKCEKQKET